MGVVGYASACITVKRTDIFREKPNFMEPEVESKVVKEVRERRQSLRPTAGPVEKDIKEVLGDETDKIHGQSIAEGGGENTPMKQEVRMRRASLKPVGLPKEKDITEVLGNEKHNIDVVQDDSTSETNLQKEVKARRASLKPTEGPKEKDIKEVLGDEKHNIGTIVEAAVDSPMKAELRTRRASLKPTEGPKEKDIKDIVDGDNGSAEKKPVVVVSDHDNNNNNNNTKNDQGEKKPVVVANNDQKKQSDVNAVLHEAQTGFRQYLDTHTVIPLVRELVRDLLLEQPEKPLAFMLHWVEKKKKNTH